MNKNKQKYGIIAPMPSEIELIIAHMKVDKTTSVGMRTYYEGKINDTDCVVALSRIGKVASGVTAAIMIDRFNVDALLLTGVAGAISPQVAIGDIVLSSSCIQHDLDARPLFPQFEVPLLEKTFFESDRLLVDQAYSVMQRLINEELEQHIPIQYYEELNLTQPKVHKGIIVSGDQFIGNQIQLEKIRADIPLAMAVEMEGGAVGQICYEYNVPFVNVRSISDRADALAHIDFNKYVENIAKHYTWALVTSMCM